MTESMQLALVVLAALLAGAAIPVLVQLYVTLGAVKRTASRVDVALTQVSTALADVRSSAQADGTAALVSAIAPAALAAIRAFRTAAKQRDTQATTP